MKNTFIALGASCVLLLGGAALADPKPQGAKPASAQAIANHYAGKTVNWKSCKAGIYYGGQWQAQAFCEKKGKSVGLGKWSVSSKGRVCHTLTWYWSTGEGYGSKPQDKEECISHVAAPDGSVWMNWENDNEWWPMATSKSFAKGFKYKGKVNRLRKKIGV